MEPVAVLPPDRVDEAGEESFPASDPPARTVVIGATLGPPPARPSDPDTDGE